MIQVIATPSSVTVRDTKTSTSVAVRIANSVIEFYQSINDNDGKAAMQVQNALTSIVRTKIDKKLSYKERFNKLAKLIGKMEGADNFRKVLNRLEKVEAV